MQKPYQHWLVAMIIMVTGTRSSCHPLGTQSLI